MKHLWINSVIPALQVVLWLAPGSVHGYDGYSACPKTYRSVRHRAHLPCDFQQQSWCTVPGSAYPWHAVRRFVHENHGLMRRMYGDERHISVLRAEIESNDVELVRDPGWHLEDDVKRRYSAKPHFRPANRNHHQPPPPPPPLPPSPPEVSTAATTATSPQTSASTSSTASTTTIGTSTPTSTSTSTATATTHADTTTSSTAGSPSTSTTDSSSEPLVESLGMYNGRIHPHIFNVSDFVSTASRPPLPDSSTTSTTSPTTTSTTVSDTTVDDWVTDDTTLNTLPSSVSTAPSLTSTSTQAPVLSTATSAEDDELADVEENVADEPDGEADSETLFQDADSGPGPDAAQQPGKPATPLIKLRGVNACPVKEEVVAPFWANNTRGEVLALLNLYPFEQYVHWEKCTHEHKQMFCREGCRCEQQYRLHRLLAYDPNNECRGIFSDWFKFPSCCICRCYDLPAEFRFTSRSPRTPVLRAPAPSGASGASGYPQRRPLPSPHAASAKDWYRLQAGGAG